MASALEAERDLEEHEAREPWAETRDDPLNLNPNWDEIPGCETTLQILCRGEAL